MTLSLNDLIYLEDCFNYLNSISQNEDKNKTNNLLSSIKLKLKNPKILESKYKKYIKPVPLHLRDVASDKIKTHLSADFTFTVNKFLFNRTMEEFPYGKSLYLKNCFEKKINVVVESRTIDKVDSQSEDINSQKIK